MIYVMTIGQRIRRLRLLRGWSQQAFAEALGIAQSHMHKLETGDDMRVRTLIKVADKLEVKPGVLLDEEEYERAAASTPTPADADAQAVSP